MGTAVYVAEVCRLYVLISLFCAAAGKSVRIDEFRRSLVDYFDVPQGIGGSAAAVIVGFEGLIAALILGRGVWGHIGMLAALLLLTAFTAVIVVALVKDRVIRCRCFGDSNHRISAYDVARNIGFVSACVFSLSFDSSSLVLDWLSYALLAPMAFILFLISVSLRDITRLVWPSVARGHG